VVNVRDDGNITNAGIQIGLFGFLSGVSMAKFGLISFYLESRRLARRGQRTEEKSGRQMNRRPHPSCV
jgi:hypothetical protein